MADEALYRFPEQARNQALEGELRDHKEALFRTEDQAVASEKLFRSQVHKKVRDGSPLDGFLRPSWLFMAAHDR